MKNFKGKLFLLLAFSLAGTSVITGYVLSEKLSSFTITAISLSIVLFCLSPMYGVKTILTIRLLKKRDWMMLILQALFGIFLFRTFLLFGVGFTSTVEAGILTGTTPAITSIMAFFILKESLTRWKALGIAGTVMGIALLQFSNLHSIHFSIQHIGGNVLILCAAASESTFNIISRKHRTKKNHTINVQMQPMVQTLIVSSIALVLSVIPAILEHPFSSVQMIGFKEWFALLWYGLFVTAFAFVFFYEGIKHCDAFTTAAFSGMIPLTSMLLSFFLLKETMGYTQCGGGILIILSMLLIGRVSSEKEMSFCPTTKKEGI